MARPPSLLSDDLLRQLIAAGQADIVVGVPTLDNAATVGPVVTAVQLAAASTVGHQRVLVLNSDGGSSDATQRVVADAAAGTASAVMASHTLRTMHRILAPYHGLPGKQAAVRTIFAVADLFQARAVVVVDPNSTDPSPDLFRALIASVLDAGCDFVATAPDRDPREGPLVTQVVRPLLIGALGASFDDPVGEEFAASRRFVGSALAQPAWDDGPLRPGIDVWLRVHALTKARRTRQVRMPPRGRGAGDAAGVARRGATGGARHLEQPRHGGVARWSAGRHLARRRAPRRRARPRLPTGSSTSSSRCSAMPPATSRRCGARRSRRPSSSSCATRRPRPTLHVADDVWANILVDISRTAARHARPDDLAAAFVPIYLGRVASFLAEARPLDAGQVHARLDTLAMLVAAQRDRLVEAWASSRDGGK